MNAAAAEDGGVNDLALARAMAGRNRDRDRAEGAANAAVGGRVRGLRPDNMDDNIMA